MTAGGEHACPYQVLLLRSTTTKDSVLSGTVPGSTTYQGTLVPSKKRPLTDFLQCISRGSQLLLLGSMR